MLRTVYGQVSFAALVLVVVAAIALGGRTEKAGAAVLGAGSLLGMTAQAAAKAFDPVWALLGVDLLIFAGFVALTWRSAKRWPFVAVAFQGVGLAVHVIRLFTHGMNPWIYLTAVGATGYAVMATLAVGVWQAWRAPRIRFIS